MRLPLPSRMGCLNSEAAIQQGTCTVSFDLRLIEMWLQMTFSEVLLVLTPARDALSVHTPAGDVLSVHTPAGDVLSVHTPAGGCPQSPHPSNSPLGEMLSVSTPI